MVTQEIERIIAELVHAPTTIHNLRRATLPVAGLYSWWRLGDKLPDVPAAPHASVPGLALIYVGVGPTSAASGETLRSRVIGKHVEGNTGSSTLRLSLAAHLLDTLHLHPRATAKKVVLDPTDSSQLTAWMEQHLRVSWTFHPSPWEVERDVIRALRPPLNTAHNHDHPYVPTNAALRRAFRNRGRSV